MTSGEIILKLIKDVTGVKLELDEEFSVNCNNLKVTQEGLVYVDGGHSCYVPLQGFIDEIKAIKVKPKFPNDGTKYYCITKKNDIYDWVFNKHITFDVLNFKTGNFFLTREEAEKNKEKIMKFLNNPEKIKECI